MRALFRRGAKKTGKTKKARAARPSPKKGITHQVPVPRGAVKKTRQTAKPKPATAPA